jgi:2'-hydroxyisoflavone reductase
VARILEVKTKAKIARVKILLVGGTIFLGRHIVEAALARGHEVTTVTRGKHNTGLHPQVEALTGDRNRDVSALAGRRWDAVIDTCGYVPGGVKRVIDAIGADRVEHYTFVSSVSVYAEHPSTGSDERAPVATITPEQAAAAEEMATGDRATARTYAEMYGALKALCEVAAEQRLPGRVLNVRPGLIVGPYDYMDRFTYWVRRISEGGEVLAPGRPDRRVRVIDARDLAEWIVRMVDQRTTGVFNATGAEDGLTFGRMLDVCRDASASDARFTWVDQTYLLSRDVGPWGEMPLWIPEADNGIFEARNDKAIAAGLMFRPLDATVRETLEWDRTRPRDKPLNAGLGRERERELLNDAPHPAH